MVNILLILTSLIIIGLTATIIVPGQQQAFGLKHFFNCITDISNKDGGDNNLTLQQVIDCFHKEFPNNNDSISASGTGRSIISIP